MSEKSPYPMRPVERKIFVPTQVPDIPFVPAAPPMEPQTEQIVTAQTQPIELPTFTAQPPKPRRSWREVAGSIWKAVRREPNPDIQRLTTWERMPRYFNQGDIEVRDGTVVFSHSDPDNSRDPRAGLYAQVQDLYDSLPQHHRQQFIQFIQNLPTAEERALPIGEAPPREHNGTYRQTDETDEHKDIPTEEEPNVIAGHREQAALSEPEIDPDPQGSWTRNGMYIILPGTSIGFYRSNEELDEHSLER